MRGVRIAISMRLILVKCGRGVFSLEIIIVRLRFLSALKGYTEECYASATEMLNLLNICMPIFFLHLNGGFSAAKP